MAVTNTTVAEFAVNIQVSWNDNKSSVIVNVPVPAWTLPSGHSYIVSYYYKYQGWATSAFYSSYVTSSTPLSGFFPAFNIPGTGIASAAVFITAVPTNVITSSSPTVRFDWSNSPNGTSYRAPTGLVEVAPTTYSVSTPTNLRVTGGSTTSIQLQWDYAGDTSAVWFVVYRNGQPLKFNTYGAPDSTFYNSTVTTDSGLQPDSAYKYTVKTVSRTNTAITSSVSSELTARTNKVVEANPTPPTNVAATSVTSPSNVATTTVTWNPSPGSTDTNVYKKKSDGTEQLVGTVTGGGTSLIDNNVVPGTSNTYVTKAVNSVGGEGYSSSAPVTTSVPANSAGTGVATPVTPGPPPSDPTVVVVPTAPIVSPTINATINPPNSGPGAYAYTLNTSVTVSWTSQNADSVKYELYVGTVVADGATVGASGSLSVVLSTYGAWVVKLTPMKGQTPSAGVSFTISVPSEVAPDATIQGTPSLLANEAGQYNILMSQPSSGLTLAGITAEGMTVSNLVATNSTNYTFTGVKHAGSDFGTLQVRAGAYKNSSNVSGNASNTFLVSLRHSYQASATPTSLSEGGTVTFTFSTSDKSISTVYWRLKTDNPNYCNANDIVGSESGSVAVAYNGANISVSVKNDNFTDGSLELLALQFFRDAAHTDYLCTSQTAAVNDTSVSAAPVVTATMLDQLANTRTTLSNNTTTSVVLTLQSRRYSIEWSASGAVGDVYIVIYDHLRNLNSGWVKITDVQSFTVAGNAGVGYLLINANQVGQWSFVLKFTSPGGLSTTHGTRVSVIPYVSIAVPSQLIWNTTATVSMSVSGTVRSTTPFTTASVAVTNCAFTSGLTSTDNRVYTGVVKMLTSSTSATLAIKPNAFEVVGLSTGEPTVYVSILASPVASIVGAPPPSVGLTSINSIVSQLGNTLSVNWTASPSTSMIRALVDGQTSADFVTNGQTSGVYTTPTGLNGTGTWLLSLAPINSSGVIIGAETPKTRIYVAGRVDPLVASAHTVNSIVLSWSPLPGVSSYAYTKNSVAQNAISSSSVTVTATGLSAGTSYNFTIAGTYPGSVNGPVASVTAYTLTSAPSALSLNGAPSYSSVPLKWSGAVGASSYNIYRDGALMFSSLTTTFTDNYVAPSTSYRYWASAINPDGMESSTSTSLLVAVPAQAAASTAVTLSLVDGATGYTSNVTNGSSGLIKKNSSYSLKWDAPTTASISWVLKTGSTTVAWGNNFLSDSASFAPYLTFSGAPSLASGTCSLITTTVRDHTLFLTFVNSAGISTEVSFNWTVAPNVTVNGPASVISGNQYSFTIDTSDIPDSGSLTTADVTAVNLTLGSLTGSGKAYQISATYTAGAPQLSVSRNAFTVQTIGNFESNVVAPASSAPTAKPPTISITSLTPPSGSSIPVGSNISLTRASSNTTKIRLVINEVERPDEIHTAPNPWSFSTAGLSSGHIVVYLRAYAEDGTYYVDSDRYQYVLTASAAMFISAVATSPYTIAAQWDSVIGVNSYTLKIVNNSTGAIAKQVDISGLTFTVTDSLVPGTTYRVVVYGSDGTTTHSSSEVTVTMPSFVGSPPTITETGDNFIKYSIPDTYSLAAYGLMGTVYLNGSAILPTSKFAVGSTGTISNLAPNTSYTVGVVYQYNAQTPSSMYTASATTANLLPAPTITNWSSHSIDLHWPAVSGQSYTLWYSSSNDSTPGVGSPITISTAPIAGNIYEKIAGLLADTTYYVRYSANSGSVNSDKYSSYAAVHTNPPPGPGISVEFVDYPARKSTVIASTQNSDYIQSAPFIATGQTLVPVTPTNSPYMRLGTDYTHPIAWSLTGKSGAVISTGSDLARDINSMSPFLFTDGVTSNAYFATQNVVGSYRLSITVISSDTGTPSTASIWWTVPPAVTIGLMPAVPYVEAGSTSTVSFYVNSPIEYVVSPSVYKFSTSTYRVTRATKTGTPATHTDVAQLVGATSSLHYISTSSSFEVLPDRLGATSGTIITGELFFGVAGATTALVDITANSFITSGVYGGTNNETPSNTLTIQIAKMLVDIVGSAPASGSTVYVGDPVSISWAGANYHHVNSYVDGVLQASSIASPHVINTTGMPVGTRVVTLKAFNPTSSLSTSSAVAVSLIVKIPIPDDPAAPTFTAVSATSIAMTWPAVSNATQYKVYKNSSTTPLATVTTTTYTATGLVAGTQYSFGIEAVGSSGGSGSGPTSSAVTLPPAPVGVVYGSVLEDQFTMSWSPALSAGSYRVYVGSTATQTVSSTGTTITGLQALTTYSVTVAGINASGEGAKSAVISPRTTALVQPTVALTFVNQTNNTQTSVLNGNCGVLRREFNYQLGWSAPTATQPIKWSLKASTQFVSSGTDFINNASSYGNFLTPSITPSNTASLYNMVTTGQVGNWLLSLEFKSPNGGITTSTVGWTTAPGITITGPTNLTQGTTGSYNISVTHAPTAGSFLIGDLTLVGMTGVALTGAGTEYVATLRYSLTTTTGSVSVLPATFTVANSYGQTVNNTYSNTLTVSGDVISLQITASDPANNGTVVLGNPITISKSSRNAADVRVLLNSAVTGTNTVNSATAIIPTTGLGTGTYAIKLRGYATDGVTYVDSTQTVTIKAINPLPVTPSTPVVNTVTTTTAVISWTTVTNAVQYKVYKQGTAAAVATLGNTSSYSITGLVGGTTYGYGVESVGTSGSGGTSTYVSVQTLPAIPATPILVGAQEDQLSVKWASVFGADEYEVYVGGTSFTRTASTQTVITGLVPNTSYSIQVASSNESGMSAKSTALATKTALPQPPVTVWSLNGAVTTATTLGPFSRGTTQVLSWDSPRASQPIRWNLKAGTKFIGSGTDLASQISQLAPYVESAGEITSSATSLSLTSNQIADLTMLIELKRDNGGASTTTLAWKVLPVATINGPANLVYGSSSTYTITLSDPPSSNSFAGADITLVGSTLLAFTGTNVNYSAVIKMNTGTTATSTATVAATKFTSVNSVPQTLNNNTGNVFLIKGVAMTATITSTSPINSLPLQLGRSVSVNWTGSNATRYAFVVNGAVVETLPGSNGTYIWDTSPRLLGTNSILIRALAPDGTTFVDSNRINFNITSVLPQAPANIRFVSATSRSVTVAWDDATNAVYYKAYRSGKILVDGTTTNLTHTFQDLTPSTQYTVLAIATNIKGDGPQSNNLIVTTAPTQASTASITLLGDTFASIAWPQVPNASSYVVYRGTNTGNLAPVGETATTDWSDSALTGNSTYYYAVAASSSSGVGDTSDLLLVNTLPPAPPRIKFYMNGVESAATIAKRGSQLQVSWASDDILATLQWSLAAGTTQLASGTNFVSDFNSTSTFVSSTGSISTGTVVVDTARIGKYTMSFIATGNNGGVNSSSLQWELRPYATITAPVSQVSQTTATITALSSDIPSVLSNASFSATNASVVSVATNGLTATVVVKSLAPVGSTYSLVVPSDVYYSYSDYGQVVYNTSSNTVTVSSDGVNLTMSPSVVSNSSVTKGDVIQIVWTGTNIATVNPVLNGVELNSRVVGTYQLDTSPMSYGAANFWMKGYATDASVSTISNALQFSIVPPLPLQPTNVTVTNITTSSASVSWQGAAHAEYYRVITNGSGVTSTNTTTVASSLPPGSTQTVQISSINATGASTATATTFQTLSMPPLLSHTTSTENSITVDVAPATGSNSWQVLLSTSSNGGALLTTTDQTSVLIDGLTPRTRYFVSAKSVNNTGVGPESTPIEANTASPVGPAVTVFVNGTTATNTNLGVLSTSTDISWTSSPAPNNINWELLSGTTLISSGSSLSSLGTLTDYVSVVGDNGPITLIHPGATSNPVLKLTFVGTNTGITERIVEWINPYVASSSTTLTSPVEIIPGTTSSVELIFDTPVVPGTLTPSDFELGPGVTVVSVTGSGTTYTVVLSVATGTTSTSTVSLPENAFQVQDSVGTPVSNSPVFIGTITPRLVNATVESVTPNSGTVTIGDNITIEWTGTNAIDVRLVTNGSAETPVTNNPIVIPTSGMTPGNQSYVLKVYDTSSSFVFAAPPVSKTLAYGLPAPVPELTVVGISTTTVSLTWDPTPTGSPITGFKMYRDTNGANTVTTTLSTTTDVYNDSRLAPNSTYRYRITSFNPTGESTPTPVVLTTLPGSTSTNTSTNTGSDTTIYTSTTATTTSTTTSTTTTTTTDTGTTTSTVTTTTTTATVTTSTTATSTATSTSTYTPEPGGSIVTPNTISGCCDPCSVYSVPCAITPDIILRTEEITSTSVKLSWVSTTSDLGETYLVYRNRCLIGKTSGTSYIDTRVLPGFTYYYKLETENLDCSCDKESNGLCVTTKIIDPVSEPSIVSRVDGLQVPQVYSVVADAGASKQLEWDTSNATKVVYRAVNVQSGDVVEKTLPANSDQPVDLISGDASNWKVTLTPYNGETAGTPVVITAISQASDTSVELISVSPNPAMLGATVTINWAVRSIVPSIQLMLNGVWAVTFPTNSALSGAYTVTAGNTGEWALTAQAVGSDGLTAIGNVSNSINVQVLEQTNNWNDYIEHAYVVSTGTTAGTNVGATLASSELGTVYSGFNSVWYKWIAPTTGTVVVRVQPPTH